MERMALLYGRLRNSTGADVRLLAGDQVLVSRNMVRNPAFERDGKTATHVPGPDGYEVYASCRPLQAHEALAAVSQRMTGPSAGPVGWDARTMRLRLDPPATSGDWLVLDSHGEVVTVHAGAGSPQVLDEVNAVLSEIEAVLLT